MPQLTEDDQDSKLNPGQQHADSRFGTHDKIEGYDRSSDGFDDIVGNTKSQPNQASKLLGFETDSASTSTGDNTGGLLKGEQNYHVSNYAQDVAKNMAVGKKPKGPVGWIIGILVGGGITFSMLASPGLLLVHIKETLSDRFNTQLTSLDRRANAIMRTKVSKTTSGFCAGSLSIRCKYSTMSDKHLKAYQKLGWEVKTDGKTIFGRHKPTGFHKIGTPDSEIISADQFASEYKKNPVFRKVVNAVNKAKSLSFIGEHWDESAAARKLSKNPKIKGDTDEEMAKSLNDSVKNGITDNGERVRAGDKKPNSEEVYTEEEANKINSAVEELVEEADDSLSKGLTEIADDVGVEEIAKKTASTTAKSVFTGLKITGVVDIACQVYTATRAVGYAAKEVGAIQLARYALVFLSTADAIKAGKATPAQVEFLGKTLTSIATDSNGKSLGSGTDSYGYKYAQYLDSGPMPASSSRFLAGAGFGGGLINVTSAINQALGGGARGTCKVLANPLVGAASIVIGLTAAVFSGGISLTTNEILVASLSVGFSVALALAPMMLQDIIAGNRTLGIIGANAMDAIVSGSGSLMSGLANWGGLSLMSKEDAIAYNEAQAETIAMYGKDEASDLSPLDPTNKYTFLGSIISSLLPNISSISSVSGGFSSVLSIIGSSFRSLLPTTNAISSEKYKESLEVCGDIDYKDLNIAADPFCNAIFGITPKYLDKDPTQVIDELSGQIDGITGEPLAGSDYESFVTKCIKREHAYEPGDGDECIINNNNANYYLHYVDQRISADMDGKEEYLSSSLASSTDTEPIDLSTTNNNTTTLYADSSNTSCATGTIDNGVKEGYNNGNKVMIKTCRIPGTYDTSTGTTAIVNAKASNQFLLLINKLKAFKGVSTLSVNASFRTYSTQAALYAKYGSKRAARPGYSNHQMGLAIDFQLSTTSTHSDGSFDATKPRGKDAVYDWLTDNARKYGIEKIPTEAWHWQTIGLQ